MATFNELLKPSMTDIEIFRLFALSHEFRNIVVRQEEKDELRKLMTRVPIPVKEGMEEPSAKVNVLLQAYISRLRMDGFALVSDMVYVHQSAARLFRALFEICLRRGWAELSVRMLKVCKMVDRRMWPSQTPLRQFGKLDEGLLRKIEKKDMEWDRFYDLKPSDIGELLREPKRGKTVHKLVHQFPRMELRAHVQPVTRSTLRVELSLAPDFQYSSSVHGPSQLWWVLVEDADGEALVHYESFNLKAKYAGEEATITFTVPLYDPMPPQYFIRLVSDKWLEASTTLPLSFKHLILPDKTRPHTDLLDMQPLPVTAMEREDFVSVFAADFKTFNPIQTQSFKALYHGDDNVLVAAPAGSGKTVCAEIAVLRCLANSESGKVVYVAPKDAVVSRRFEQWNSLFGEKLGVPVAELTGETSSDLKLMGGARIIVSNPANWDKMSRKWKLRKAVLAVELFIVDDLHLIGGSQGPAIEFITSRMRYIASQIERPIRIVALSASLSNAVDVGSWLGAKPSTTFNFAPDVRPVPLELRIQGYDIAHFGSRLLAMARPAFAAVKTLASAERGDPAIVFVPSRRQAQLTAIDMMKFAAATSNPGMFVGNGNEGKKACAAAAESMLDATLAAVVEQGVAYYHGGMPEATRRAVEALYEDGHVNILVATADMAWGMRMGAHVVVIMDTVRYDGREHRYVDYPISDVLHMMGRAQRIGIDSSGYCVLQCHLSRKEYLRKFVGDALPVESHLHHMLHDHFNAEIATKTIESKQEALDYLTWTLLYRRLHRNPNYYGLHGTSQDHLRDFLSELVDTTIGDLEVSHCIEVDDDDSVSFLNLGAIASHYYLRYTTVELFASSIGPKTKLKGILEILCAATEFESLPIKHGEESVLARIAKHLPVALPTDARYNDPHTKANILLQSHFSRKPLPADLRADQRLVVAGAVPLLAAMVDVISSSGWLKPALAVMEMTQMVVQGLWAKDSVLLQIPHFTAELADKCAATAKPEEEEEEEDEEEEGNVESVYDIMELPDDFRESLLALPPAKMADVARFCNRYPNVDMAYRLAEEADGVAAGGVATLKFHLEREEGTEGLDEGAGLGAVFSPRFPKAKSESWWVVVADPSKNALLAVKSVAFGKAVANGVVRFLVPEDMDAGKHTLQVLFMCDSYMGCDQEYELDVEVRSDE
jgi:pre-mRNA-splicing helicase BRR2